MTFVVRLRDLDGEVHTRAVVNGLFARARHDTDHIIDVANGYAVAGLVDAHAHLTGADVDQMATGEAMTEDAVRVHAARQVEAGVLLVADKGSRLDSPLRLDHLELDQRPEVSAAGPMVTVPRGYYPGFARELSDPADVASWIDDAIGSGTQWLKLVGDWPRQGEGVVQNFTRSQLEAIVVASHRRGVRVAIHAAGPTTPSDAVAAGVDSIEHGLFLDDGDLATLGARGGAWVPTIAAMEGIRDVLGHDSSGGRMLGDGLDNVRRLLGTAPTLGVNVMAGTDLHLPHGAVAQEVERMVAYGLDPGEAVRSVTTGGYSYLGVERSFDIGQPADLVALRADPRHDIATLGDPVLIIRRGRIVRHG